MLYKKIIVSYIYPSVEYYNPANDSIILLFYIYSTYNYNEQLIL